MNLINIIIYINTYLIYIESLSNILGNFYYKININFKKNKLIKVY